MFQHSCNIIFKYNISRISYIENNVQSRASCKVAHLKKYLTIIDFCPILYIWKPNGRQMKKKIILVKVVVIQAQKNFLPTLYILGKTNNHDYGSMINRVVLDMVRDQPRAVLEESGSQVQLKMRQLQCLLPGFHSVRLQC